MRKDNSGEGDRRCMNEWKARTGVGEQMNEKRMGEWMDERMGE